MNAIVLGRRDFKEVDQLISCYTQERGRVDLIARGVKKITSKNGAALEPFSFVHLGFANGKELDYLTSVQSKEYFPAIRNDLQKGLYAGFIVFLVSTLVYGDEPDERIFFLLLQTLSALEDTTQVTLAFLDSFVIRLLSLLGFTPKISSCLFCDKKAGSANSYVFYINSGGIVCSTCANKAELSLTLVESDRQIFLEMLETEENNITSTEALHRCIYTYMQFHTESRVADWKNIEKWLI
jgi:DNA repair protein RecO (recombination protein O)